MTTEAIVIYGDHISGEPKQYFKLACSYPVTITNCQNLSNLENRWYGSVTTDQLHVTKYLTIQLLID